MGWQGRRRTTARWRGIGAALAALGVLLLLSACSSGSDSKLNLGLAGSTSDHPSQPPALASNGPSAGYAFVYDNQIWLHANGQQGAKQLTHLVLSRGAAISWGPLVWSGTGRYIAFALVENLTPSAPSRGSGPIYYVDTQNGTVVNTAATGSIYGHTYDWYGDTMLFYSTGGGVMMYGAVNTGGDDPRVWSAITQFRDQGGPEGRTVSGLGYAYGDVVVTNNYLYYTRIALDNAAPLGVAGPVGSADLRRAYIGGLANLPSSGPINPLDINNLFPLSGSPFLGLGAAYSDAMGNFVAGSWAITETNSGTFFVTQNIKAVDGGKGTVTSQFCSTSYSCGVMQSAASYTFAAYPNLAISPDGSRVAFTSDTLFVANHSGGGDGKLPKAGWTTPPDWSNDGKLVAVTQVTGITTDANGVARPQTNVLIFDGGASTVLVPGGQDLAWQPPAQ